MSQSSPTIEMITQQVNNLGVTEKHVDSTESSKYTLGWEEIYLMENPCSPDQFLSAEEVEQFFANKETSQKVVPTHGAHDKSSFNDPNQSKMQQNGNEYRNPDVPLTETTEPERDQNCNEYWQAQPGLNSTGATAQSN